MTLMATSHCAYLKFGSVCSSLTKWHSGRTSVFGRRTFPVLRSTCSWRV